MVAGLVRQQRAAESGAPLPCHPPSVPPASPVTPSVLPGLVSPPLQVLELSQAMPTPFPSSLPRASLPAEAPRRSSAQAALQLGRGAVLGGLEQGQAWAEQWRETWAAGCAEGQGAGLRGQRGVRPVDILASECGQVWAPVKVWKQHPVPAPRPHSQASARPGRVLRWPRQLPGPP